MPGTCFQEAEARSVECASVSECANTGSDKETCRGHVSRRQRPYWNIGRIIAEPEQTVPERADYGKQTLKESARVLTREFGKGFSRANLYNMRQFYLTYEKIQTVSGQLSWSHYCELLAISEDDKRSFYEKEAINSNWSVRELKRQIDSYLYERLLLSGGNVNKETVVTILD